MLSPAAIFPQTVLARPPPLPTTSLLRIVSWNLNSLKAALTKAEAQFKGQIKTLSPSVLFLSETKLQQQYESQYKNLLGSEFTAYFSSSTAKKGYSGTAAFVRRDAGTHDVTFGIEDPCEPLEGRSITIEFPGFYFLGLYVPNSGQDLMRLDFRVEEWDKAVARYVAKLSMKKPVVMGGDLNVCPGPPDVYNNSAPHIKKQAGCTERERASFAQFLTSQDRVDAFRFLYPDAVGWFSYFSMRGGGKSLNRGLRLDEYVVPRSLMSTASIPVRVHDCWIVSDVSEMGISDHVPVVLDLELRN